jgi:hypothetical protein
MSKTQNCFVSKTIPLLTIFIFISQFSFAQWITTGNTNIGATNFLGTTNNNPIRFRTNSLTAGNNIDRMVILPGGNVGIGTSTPANRLSISSGTAGVSGLQFVNLNSSNTASAGGGKYLAVDASGNVVLVTVPSSTLTGTLPVSLGGTGLTTLGTANQQMRVNAAGTALEYFTPVAGGANIYTANGSLSSNRFVELSTSTLSFGKGANTNLHLFNNGNVWIGNGTPADAGFNLNINGTSRTGGNATITGDILLGSGGIVRSTTTTGLTLSNNGHGNTQVDLANIVPISGLGLRVGSVGNATASTIFEVTSTTRGSVPAPLMTLAQRTAITSPTTGLFSYQTDGTEGIYVKQSGAWRRLLTEADAIGGGSTIYTSNGTLTSNRFVELNTSTLSFGKSANTNFHLFNNGNIWMGNGAPADNGVRLNINGNTAFTDGELQFKTASFANITRIYRERDVVSEGLVFRSAGSTGGYGSKFQFLTGHNGTDHGYNILTMSGGSSAWNYNAVYGGTGVVGTRYDASARVSILTGETSSTALSIYNPANSGGSASYLKFSSVLFGDGSPSSGGYIKYQGIANTYGGDVVLGINNGSGTTNETDVLTVHRSGNVLIGTSTNNGDKLQVNGGTQINLANQTQSFKVKMTGPSNWGTVADFNFTDADGVSNSYGLKIKGYNDGQRALNFAPYNATSVIFSGNEYVFENSVMIGGELFGQFHSDLNFRLRSNTTGTPKGIKFYSDNFGSTPVMAIMQDGNVGIGNNATPSEKLEVSGNIKSTGFILPTGAGVGKVLTSDANGVASWQNASAGISSSSVENGITFNTTTQKIELGGSLLKATTINQASYNLLFSGTGNIGIGKANPTEKLEVNGTIVAQKVRVTQTGWADYVFDTDYKLPTLSEIEEYIKKHKHLPEIPTTEEVKEKGADLGDTQVLLLKKVEELTLYLIQQNKEIEKLKKELTELKKEKKN